VREGKESETIVWEGGKSSLLSQSDLVSYAPVDSDNDHMHDVIYGRRRAFSEQAARRRKS